MRSSELSSRKPQARAKTQKQIRSEVESGLRSREIVSLWGKPNGKTHTFWQVWLQHVIANEGKAEIKRNHAENFTVEILPNVKIGGKNLRTDSMKRQILETYGYRNARWMSDIDMRKEYRKLLDRLYDARIIPCIAMDNAELMPEKGYTILKELNEERTTKGKRGGVAVLLAGEFSKRKMPPNFWMHCTEINIGKVTAEEMTEFIADLVGAHYASGFKAPAIKRLLECGSTLEMSRYIKLAAKDMSEGVLDEVGASQLDEYSETDSLKRHRLAA